MSIRYTASLRRRACSGFDSFPAYVCPNIHHGLRFLAPIYMPRAFYSLMGRLARISVFSFQQSR